jgi:hypothetical protein
MNRIVRALAAMCALVLAMQTAVHAAPESKEAVDRSGGGLRSFSYTLVATTPQTQYAPNLFVGPYFNYTLTNTGTQQDTYHMTISNLSNPGWFGQVCIGTICFPEEVDVTLAPNESKVVGVNIVPFSDGMSTGDYDLASLGNPSLSSHFVVTLYAGSDTGVGDVLSSGGFHLAQNAPNPVREGTSIAFSMAHSSYVDLSIFDVGGRLVRALVSGEQAAGTHTASWNGADDSGMPVASGIYLYRLSTPEGVLTKSLTLVK